MSMRIRRGVAARLVALLAVSAPGCPAPSAIAPHADASAAASDAASLPPEASLEAGAAEPASSAAPSEPAEPKRTTFQRGRATYYSNRFSGRKTANGERYDPRAMTAAHRTLPFGAVVDVVRRDGRRVRVRINDRGPFVKGRVIDLSRSAAEAIGLIREGVAEVALEVVSLPERPAKQASRPVTAPK